MKGEGKVARRPPPPPRATSGAKPVTWKVVSEYPRPEWGAKDGWIADYAPARLPTTVEMLWGPVFGSGGSGLAKLSDDDTFVELGCGQGGVLLAAHRSAPKCRIVGIELDEQIAVAAREFVAAEVPNIDGRAPPITVLCGGIDDFLGDEASTEKSADAGDRTFSISEATFVYAFLTPYAMVRLRPQLLRSLPVGARIMTRRFTMGRSWPADEECCCNGGDTYRLYIVTASRKEDPVLLSDFELEQEFAEMTTGEQQQPAAGEEGPGRAAN